MLHPDLAETSSLGSSVISPKVTISKAARRNMEIIVAVKLKGKPPPQFGDGPSARRKEEGHRDRNGGPLNGILSQCIHVASYFVRIMASRLAAQDGSFPSRSSCPTRLALHSSLSLQSACPS